MIESVVILMVLRAAYQALSWHQYISVRYYISPLTGAVYISFLHFLLARHISAFEPVKDK